MTAAATWYSILGSNDTYWRVTNPAKQVQGKVCFVEEGQLAVFGAPHDFDPFPWTVREDDLFDYPSHEGVAVWTRPCLYRAQHTMAMREVGIRTVAEVDDNYLSKPHLNVFMKINEYGAEGRLNHLRAMACHDAVVCATPWLRDTYHKAFRKETRVVPELHVCHNNADLDDWPAPIPRNGRLRVGWMGSSQHGRDLKLAYPALEWAHDQGHEVVLIGHDFRDETGITHYRALDACRRWRRITDRHIPWQDPATYRRTALPLDIGLAPVERNDHTMGKSDVKAIEYVMSGAVPILQNHPIYSGTWKHNETALLANSQEEFLVAVMEACSSESLRQRLLSAGEQYVREERSNERTKKEWGEALCT